MPTSFPIASPWISGVPTSSKRIPSSASECVPLGEAAICGSCTPRWVENVDVWLRCQSHWRRQLYRIASSFPHRGYSARNITLLGGYSQECWSPFVFEQVYGYKYATEEIKKKMDATWTTSLVEMSALLMEPSSLEPAAIG
jgi:hypothetical protein